MSTYENSPSSDIHIPLNGPELVKMAAKIVGLRSIWCRAAIKSSIRACDNAFLFRGRFNSKIATPPSLTETTKFGCSVVVRLMVPSSSSPWCVSQYNLANISVDLTQAVISQFVLAPITTSLDVGIEQVVEKLRYLYCWVEMIHMTGFIQNTRLF